MSDVELDRFLEVGTEAYWERRFRQSLMHMEWTPEECEEIRKRARPVLTFNRIEPVRSREDEIMDAIRDVARS